MHGAEVDGGGQMRVLIVDDHEVVRKGVRSLLVRSGYDVCGESVDGEDAIEKAKLLRPDVIVMDVSMPKLNGLEATRQVRCILPDSEVLILSQHESPEMVRQAFNSGARGYVVKSSMAKDLLAAIEKVGRHEPFFDPAVADATERPTHVDAQETLQRSATFEQALYENEELYRATFEQAAVGICHVALDGHFLRVNQKFCDLLGYSREELLKLTFMSLTYPEDIPRDVGNANALREGSIESYQIEKRYLRKDGTDVWAQLTVGVLRDRQRNPRSFIGVVVDIDDRKRTDAALLESENRFRTMADTAPVLVWMADTSGQWSFFNKPWLEFTGRSLQQELGNGWTLGVYPEDLDRILQTYLSSVRAQLPFTMEYRLRRTDGEYRWVLSSGVPRYSTDGRFEGYIGSCVDITPQKQMEDALRRSEDDFRILANSIPQLVWMADRNGSVVWFNQPWFDYTGTTLEQVRGTGWQTIYHPDHRARMMERVAHAWQAGEPWEDTFPLLGKNGQYRTFLSRAIPVKDDRAKVAKWFGTNTEMGEYPGLQKT
jgi:PAS domain S-box-containing protein